MDAQAWKEKPAFPQSWLLGGNVCSALLGTGLFLLRKQAHGVTHIHRKLDPLEAPLFGNPSSTDGDRPSPPGAPARLWGVERGAFSAGLRAPEVLQVACWPSCHAALKSARFSS